MVTVIGDVLRVTMQGILLNQQVNNVFFWQVGVGSTGGLGLFSFTDELEALFQSEVVNLFSVSLLYERMIIDNISNNLDFTDVGMTAQGLVTGEVMPSFAALGVRLNRSSKLTRHGGKRFAGITEAQVIGNSHTFAGVGADAIEAFCGLQIVLSNYDGAGSDVFLNPVIVGRTKNLAGVYELDLSKINPVTNADISLFVTTQNSRKA